MLNNKINILLITLTALLLMAPALYLGHVVGHSSVLNVGWADGFAHALAGGEIYPRWLPEMNGGAGSAVFYFYGPLPFYIAAPFVLATGSAALGVVLASTTMLALSGLATYFLCRHYSSPKTALVCGLIYMALPYHFSMDVMYRAAFGEQAAFLFMPLAILCVLKLPQDRRFAVGLAFVYAAQLFAHLPTALLFAPILAFFCLWTAWKERSFAVLFVCGLAGISAIGLAAIYLLPAATLQDMIQPSFWRVIAPQDHLLFSEKFLYEDFSFFIFSQSIVLAIVLYLIVAAALQWRANPALQPWLLIALVTFFFCSSTSAPFWIHAGLFNMVQLPWRMFGVLDLCLVVMLASLTESESLWQHTTYASVGVAVLLGFIITGGTQYLFYHLPDDPKSMTIGQDRKRIAIKTDASEYLPACFLAPQQEYHAMTDRFAIANLTAVATAGLEPHYYYPFLKASRAGQDIATTCDPETGYMKYDDSVGQGPVTVRHVTLPIEAKAWGISLFSLATIILAAFFGYRRKKRHGA